MKRITYISVLFFICNAMVAQNKLTNAVYNFREKEYDKAKELIDAAAEDTLFKDNASTWYFRGTIYKGIFKEREFDNRESPLRLEAVEYFKHSLSIEDTGVYANGCKGSLQYLAQTLYNHSAISFDPQNYPIAITNYERYKEIIEFVNPEEDFTEKDIMFNLALATTYARIAEQDTLLTEEFMKKSLDLYHNVLELDSNNISANYNIGIIYYNQGVEIVNNMDYSMDLIELNAVQDRIIQLFRQSLPFMKKAYDLNPKRKETLIGLQGIYFSLNDIPKSEVYKKQLEQLEQQGDQPLNQKLEKDSLNIKQDDPKNSDDSQPKSEGE